MTLVYGTRDTEHDDAVALAEILHIGIRSGGVGQKEL
jgi:hypothetical protein